MARSLYDYRNEKGKPQPKADFRPWHERLAERPGVLGFVGGVAEMGAAGAVRYGYERIVEGLGALALRAAVRMLRPSCFLLKAWDGLGEHEIGDIERQHFNNHMWEAHQWLTVGLKRAKFDKGYRRLVQSVNKG